MNLTSCPCRDAKCGNCSSFSLRKPTLGRSFARLQSSFIFSVGLTRWTAITFSRYSIELINLRFAPFVSRILSQKWRGRMNMVSLILSIFSYYFNEIQLYKNSLDCLWNDKHKNILYPLILYYVIFSINSFAILFHTIFFPPPLSLSLSFRNTNMSLCEYSPC